MSTYYWDVHCPYCHKGQEICHDDGFGYEEDTRHEMECGECGKNFVFQTVISFDYRPEKADCLNGAEHDVSPVCTSPVKYTKMRCKNCDFSRDPTKDEMEEIMKKAGVE